MRWGGRYDYDGYTAWPMYVPVAQRRAQARREVEKLRKNGQAVEPVEIQGRTIAHSFWGKGWCTHLESFGDYANRLPRGRSYVRNGSVCHLAIAKGKVEAMVSGSRLYRVAVDITPLTKGRWLALKQRCTGKIGSLIELLQGRLSGEIMQAVTDREQGLFPLPGEIRYTCNCPDWARMCKHIAAVMYGIGARLDTRPELLFLLRGVDHEELIAAPAAAETIAGTGSRRARRRTLSGAELERVFGVELDTVPEPTAGAGAGVSAPVPDKRAAKPTTPRARSRERPAKKSALFKPTARSVARLRRRLRMSRAEFARVVGVSPATVANWEKARGAIRPHAGGLAGLRRLAGAGG
ncbi:MAG: helix-turn-helix domain-containing protein [Kiritimatiellae bacterium]|nr:helix-turn-helix domain-containing protein [Kiritimatiellia bacterium]